jgi:tetratricopeptide (TPR) repeat protein
MTLSLASKSERSKSIFICLILAAVTVTAHLPVFKSGFINYDDPDYVTSNPWVQAGLTRQSVSWAFYAFHICNWHPLTWISHMADVEMFGSTSTGPHAVNVLLHCLNGMLLFLFLARATGMRWRSAVVAALFALHPTHVESVAWISERKDVLSTFFGMLTLICYRQYAEHRLERGRRRRIFFGAAIFFYALGLMSKPMLVTFPGVMFLLDFWPLRRFENLGDKTRARNILTLIAEKTPFVILSAISCAITSLAQKGAMQHLENYPLSARSANAFVSYARYVSKTFWPANLQLPYLRMEPWPEEAVFAASLLIIGLSLGAFLLRRKFPYAFTGWFWYLGTLVPVIGLVQVGIQSIADRYTYIPQIGISILVVWGVAEAFERFRWPKSVLAAAGVAVLLICASLTWRQVGFWHDSEKLFKHVVAISPDNYVALSNIGGAIFEKGNLDDAMKYYQEAHRINPRFPDPVNSIGAILASKGSDEAIEWFRKALELDPNHADAAFNMGNNLAKRGETLEATEFYRKAVELRPDNFEARNNFGNALFKLGRVDEALEQYRLALASRPNSPMIHKNLGEALAAKGKLDDAIAQYRLALSETNDVGTHYSLGLTFAVQKKWDDAIQHYIAALAFAPNNADAEYNLGYAYRMKGDLDRAAQHLSRALDIKSNFPLAHYNLGCVLADQGKRADAAAHWKEALRLKSDYEDARQKLSEIEASEQRK